MRVWLKDGEDGHEVEGDLVSITLNGNGLWCNLDDIQPSLGGLNSYSMRDYYLVKSSEPGVVPVRESVQKFGAEGVMQHIDAALVCMKPMVGTKSLGYVQMKLREAKMWLGVRF